MKSGRYGLKSAEAHRRLKAFGRNSLSEAPRSHLVKVVLKLFLNPLVLVLAGAAGISFFMHGVVSAVIIIVMIFLSVAMEFIEEHNAENTVRKLIESVKVKSAVWRDRKKIEIVSELICPGDIIELKAGDIITADCRLIESKDLFVNQAALTGESFPSEKKPDKISLKHKNLTEAENILFAGTYAVSGFGKAVALVTGKQTEYGKIAATLNAAENSSEFETGTRKFGMLVMRLALLLVGFIFVVNLILHREFFESFLFSVAIAVGLTPELLPMIMTVTMARGSAKMAKKGVIVKRLVAIPNLGSMDILCTDKTGTLTVDKIVLVRHIDIYNEESSSVLLDAYINSFYQTGANNPLDQAILDFQKLNIRAFKKINEIPFDFLRKRVSVAVKNDNENIFIAKGAPEEIFRICDTYDDRGHIREFDDEAKAKAKQLYHELSRDGFRVLAVAEKKFSVRKNEFSKSDEKNLELKGFVAFLDPPKNDADDTVRELRRIGVNIKVLTGDNELVTKKICDEIGLPVTGIILGKDIHSMSDEKLKKKAEKATIFARFTPEEKNRIIRLLRESGHVVGYLGDGINDAPSLKSADVGISVNNAVGAAKDAADIVLKHKNLNVLKEGIIEGRRSFGNTMKYIMMGLSSNFGNMFAAAGAVLFLPFLPMLPIQILLNNFIYDASQVTIPSDNVDREWIDKPQRWNLKHIRNFMLITGPVSSVFDILTFCVFFFVLNTSESAFQTAWFLESIATQTLVIHIIRTRKIPFFQSHSSRWLSVTTFGAVAAAWIFPYTPLAAFFKMTPLPLSMLLIIAGIVITYLFVVEGVKRLFYKKFAKTRI
jgi:Mg2+-importing ATPase